MNTSTAVERGVPPDVTVVMPLYNKGPSVQRAIRSVLAQTFKALELIVVDDGSTDDGPSLVAGVVDVRLRLIRQANGGVASARNAGVTAARADLLAFLDADDEWAPDFLETIQMLRASWPDAGVFGTSYVFRRPTGSRPAVLRAREPAGRCGLLRDYFIVAAASDPPLCSSSVAVTASALSAIGGFPLGVSSGEDLLTWARLAARNDVAYCREPKAAFWEPIIISDRPGRRPQVPDVVAAGLAALEGTPNPSRRLTGLRRYRALWHRMRAMIYLQLGRPAAAALEVAKALRLTPLSARLWAVACLAALPGNVSRRLLERRRKKNARR